MNVMIYNSDKSYPMSILSRLRVRLRKWASASEWYRWIHGLQDYELYLDIVSWEKAHCQREFIVFADSPLAAHDAQIVPRIGHRRIYRGQRQVCVRTDSQPWIPDLCFKVVATYDKVPARCANGRCGVRNR